MEHGKKEEEVANVSRSIWIVANNEKQSRCDRERHVGDTPGTRRKKC